jgi:hypothetical protein
MPRIGVGDARGSGTPIFDSRVLNFDSGWPAL